MWYNGSTDRAIVIPFFQAATEERTRQVWETLLSTPPDQCADADVRAAVLDGETEGV